jgi:hypothetical protein
MSNYISFKFDETNKFTESVVNIDNVRDTKGTTYADVNVGNGLLKFTNKVINYLTSCGIEKEYNAGCSSYGIRKNEDEFIYFDIKNVPNTELFFEIFKKLGIPSAFIQIGINFVTHTIYLNKGIISYIQRLKNPQFELQIYMYIISLAHMYSQLSARSENYRDKYSVNTTSLVVEDINLISSLVYSFDVDNISFEIKELDLNDIIEIRYFDNSFKLDLGKIEPQTYAILEREDNGAQCVVISRDAGIKSFYILNDDETITTIPLNMFTLNYSVEHLLTTCTTTATIRYLNVITASTNLKLVEEFKPTKNSRYNDMITSIIDNGTAYTNTDELAKLFGLDHISKSKGMFDSTDIRNSYADDAYAQELYKNEKEYYEDFDLEDMNKTITGFANGDIYTMLFYGESGTGKSTAAKVIPYKCGLPVININFSVNIEESDLFGTMIPNPEKKVAEDPEFIWKDGIITNAARHGYVVILEEITMARAGVLGKFNSLLDESRQIELPTGEILHAHPNFRIIATCNVGYEGTNMLNKALVNRFQIVKEFTELDKEAFIEVVQSRTGYTDKVKIESVYNVYKAIKKFSDENNLGLVVSIRQLLNIFTAGKYFKNAYDAVLNMLVNVAFLQDKDYKDSFVSSILPVYKLGFKL